jgi:Ca-activated chloride channel family protein
MKRQRLFFGLIVGAAVLIVAAVLCSRTAGQLVNRATGDFSKPNNAIEVSLIYAPEEDLYIRDVITDFNRSYAQGRNPVTGKNLANGERPIWVEGINASSGTVAQGIVNAFVAPNNVNVSRPVIFSPSVRHWLALVNYQTGQPVFDVNGSPSTAIAPVVIAIWESRLNAIKAKHPGQEIGWQELFEVFNSPDGWRSYGLSGRQAVYYGHTDPYVSSTAISTLLAEFYASARYATPNNSNLTQLTLQQVNDPQVQDGVRKIEQLIKHYSSRTTEFKEYIAQGPDYLDFVALEENDLIFINQGKTQYKPPEKLVALYPKEGTFLHDHPFAIPNAPWVSDEQRAAAKVFTDYVLTKEVQQKVMENGFRPANKDVPLAYPISADLGVDPSQPKTLLSEPDPATLTAVQRSWQLVKKQANVLILVDTSGSMRDNDKLTQAKDAIKVFIDDQAGKNNVGLMRFSSDVQTLVPLGSLESNRTDILNQVDSLNATGNTSLNDALISAMDTLSATSDAARIQAIVLLSDGQDTSSNASLNDAVQAISNARNSRTPVLVIPVAYGDDADISALSAIARASDTKVQSGDPQTIKSLLEIIGSYF